MKKKKEREKQYIKLYFSLTFTHKEPIYSIQKIYSYPIRELANFYIHSWPESFPNTIPKSRTKLERQKIFLDPLFAHSEITWLPAFTLQIQDHVYTFWLSDFIHPRTKLEKR